MRVLIRISTGVLGLVLGSDRNMVRHRQDKIIQSGVFRLIFTFLVSGCVQPIITEKRIPEALCRAFPTRLLVGNI